MENILTNIVSGTIVLTFMGSVFSFAILRPLNATITDLKEAIKELRLEMQIGKNVGMSWK